MKSISDVARLAGLSVASVSRVLNGSKPVTPETRDRVMRAATELHYSIDRRARALRRQKSGTIGLIVADAENPFFAQIIRSIEGVTYDSKHDLFLCNSDEDPEREQFHLQAMRAQRIDGIILLPVCATGASLAPFLQSETPIVCLDRRLPDVDLDLAIVDNVLGSALAVDHLVAQGHRRIAIITAHDETVSFERVAGFRAALARFDIAERREYERRGHDARLQTGLELTSALLGLGEPPTAIFVTNHLMLLGAMRAARMAGARVPQDLSLMGFDDTPWAELLEPPLTTIGQPTQALGTTAANLLLDRVDREYLGPSRQIVLPPSLIVRGSVGAAAARDPSPPDVLARKLSS